MTQIKGYIFDVLCENYAEILYRMRNTQFIENFWVTPRYISDNKLTRGKLRFVEEPSTFRIRSEKNIRIFHGTIWQESEID